MAKHFKGEWQCVSGAKIRSMRAKHFLSMPTKHLLSMRTKHPKHVHLLLVIHTLASLLNLAFGCLKMLFDDEVL